MRILCLPLDSRPCSTQFVQRLVTWGGSEVVLPSVEEMDYFTTPAPFETSLAFLKREFPSCDAAVISIDHLCFGSLLASRAADTPLEVAMDRMSQFRALLEEYPDVPVFASSVILRSSISALSSLDLDAYYAMTDYSYFSDRYSRFHLAEDQIRMMEAKARIPSEVLDRALQVRKRNLQINLAAADLATDGLLKSLSLLQEDSQVFGLPREDQREILRHIQFAPRRDRIFLRNGADEGCMVHCARVMWEDREPLHVNIRWWGDNTFTAEYEDHPFSQNLDNACREIGIIPDPSSSTVLFICCPMASYSHGMADVLPTRTALYSCAQTIDASVRAGNRVYVLDLFQANGGIPELLESMENADGLWGYVAWNTACNSMGTVLAQIMTDHLRGASNRIFYQERLLDDALYEGRIKAQINEKLRALGDDVYRLRDMDRALEMLRDHFQQEMPGFWPLEATPSYQVSFPWNRTFEIKAECAG